VAEECAQIISEDGSVFVCIEGLASGQLCHYAQRLSPALLCTPFKTHSLCCPLNDSFGTAVAYLKWESLCTVGVSVVLWAGVRLA